jgi:RNA recognition motif-containing protein
LYRKDGTFQSMVKIWFCSGNVVRADVAQSPAGKSRGFGTVLFSTIEEATAAVARFNNYEWHGRKIEVREDRAVSGNLGGAPAGKKKESACLCLIRFK